MYSDERTKQLETRIAELEKQIENISRDFVSREVHDQISQELLKAQHEAEDANKSKTMFLANMSHEIRTPMNSIIGIYNVLNQTDLSAEQKELLEIINISSANLLTIINDILDLSKIEAGQLKLDYKPFRIYDEIQHVIKLLSIKAKGKRIDLYQKIQSTVPDYIIGDPVRLKQILINLTNNALKFTNEGHVAVSVTAIEKEDFTDPAISRFLPDSYLIPGAITPDTVILKFEVTDTGIGISEEEQKSLFSEFAQFENPLIQQFEGTGLGLSISKNLTLLMNGKIGVISEKGKGSTFWFTLAFKKGDDEALKSIKQSVVTHPLNQKSLKILLVEDNILNQKFALTCLKRAGHEVEIAENGKIAVEKFKQNSFDLILMDIAMPIMDGIEATRIIRSLEKGPKRIKIVAVTAHVMVTDREKCLSSGMDEYLAKPYRPNDLIEILNSLDWGN